MRHRQISLCVLMKKSEKSLDKEKGCLLHTHKRQKKDVGTTPALQLSHYLDTLR
ncbi:Hypothetical protein FKW44_005916, partial [Caligus rogercresseyi]